MNAHAGRNGRIRVMLVDDSAVVRGLISRILAREPEIEIAASVANGRDAVEAAKKMPLDVVLLDIEMPILNGLDAIPLLLRAQPDLSVIMVSSLTVEGAEATFRALDLGAIDFVPKPQAASAIGGLDQIAGSLVMKIKACSQRRKKRSARPAAARRPDSLPRPQKSGLPEIVAVGSSTGGPEALSEYVRGLGPEFELPIVVTQHMPPLFTKMLAERLEREGGRPCREAEAGEPVLPGRTYLAPGGRHLVFRREGAAVVIELNEDPPVHYCRPAVDVMFRSLADVYGSRVLAVVLTGMGEDGRDGAASIRRAGGSVLAQDEATSIVWGMPGAVVESGIAEAVLPLDGLAGETLLRCGLEARA